MVMAVMPFCLRTANPDAWFELVWDGTADVDGVMLLQVNIPVKLLAMGMVSLICTLAVIKFMFRKRQLQTQVEAVEVAQQTQGPSPKVIYRAPSVVYQKKKWGPFYHVSSGCYHIKHIPVEKQHVIKRCDDCPEIWAEESE